MGFALYRKYRPQKFSEITGQNHIKTTLENELASDSVAHAYLLTGPRGVGKTTTARIFAKALNCLDRKKGESEPCGKCDSCREQTDGRSLDVIEIDAASNTGVDNVRENIIEHVRFAPTSRHFKIFIIDEVHMLSVSAWNALLKTLEEPPSYAVFIMCTTEAHKVPATIISRCQRFDFRRIPAPEMAERLKRLAVNEEVDVDDKVIQTIVHLSDGCLRDAESMFEQVLSLGEKKIGVDEAALVLPRSDAELVSAYFGALCERRGGDAIALVNRLVEDGVDLAQFTNDTIEFAREALIATFNANTALTSDKLPKNLSAVHIIRIINSLLVARNELKSTPIPQLPLEIVAAEHCAEASPRNFEAKPLPAEVPPQTPQNHSHVARSASSDEIISKDNLPRATSQFTTPIETVILRWDELCISVQEENPSLPFLLRVARPLRVEDGILVIGVQYKMHAEKLNSPKNINSIVRGLTALYGNDNIAVRAEISPESSGDGALTNSLISEFGGAAVE
jgi:DNA polymerase III subunit gamma/tau